MFLQTSQHHCVCCTTAESIKFWSQIQDDSVNLLKKNKKQQPNCYLSKSKHVSSASSSKNNSHQSPGTRPHTKLTSPLLSLSRLAQAAVPAEQPQTDAAHPQRRVPGHLRPLAARGYQPLPPDVSGTVRLLSGWPPNAADLHSRWLGEQLGKMNRITYTPVTQPRRACAHVVPSRN